MNVFADFHHTALLRSLIMLFEGRLGGKVYRPIGMEWYEKGFWNVYDHPATAQQFLSTDQAYRPIDGTPPLNIFGKQHGGVTLESGVYYCADPENETYNKAVSFEKFLEMDIDIVVASMPAHIEPFKRLIREHKPHAKLVLQVGNNWLWEEMGVQNVLASTVAKPYPEGMNVCFYHQEFDLSLFSGPDTANPGKTAYSFVNCLPQSADYPLFQRFKSLLPSWDFRSYGGQCPDGSKGGVRGVAQGMREARAIWHVKPGGDGFGHVVHNAFALGRPVITRKSHYAGQLAESLMEHGVTCIDLDACAEDEAVAMIRELEDETRWGKYCLEARYRFQELVNYDKEEQDIRAFIDRLS